MIVITVSDIICFILIGILILAFIIRIAKSWIDSIFKKNS